MRDSQRFVLKYWIDLILWIGVTPAAFWIRLENPLIDYAREILVLGLIGVPVKALVLYFLRFHLRSWRRIGVKDLFVLIQGVAAVTLVLAAAAFFLPPQLQVPRGIPVIEGMLALLLLGSARLGMRIFYESRQTRKRRAMAGPAPSKRVLIAGAGESGTMIAREMLRHPGAGLNPIGFVDDSPSKQRQRFLGLRVLGKIEDLPHLARSHRVDELIIAMSSESGEVIRRVVDVARTAGVRNRIIPGIYDLLSGKVAISQIREVDLEDLLRRPPVRLDATEIEKYIADRIVLVTGSGGSIGSEIVRQAARFKPRKVVLLGRGENSIYEIEQECLFAWPEIECQAVICDVRDRDRLSHVFSTHRPDVVFHAAAHKHVPLMEANPDEAVLNNVGGTKNLVELALKYDTSRFVNISTDKAVNPTSVMGASKRVAEYVVGRASKEVAPGQQFVSVRFGNVLGSRGSVIPLFKEQIKRGGPVTVTHPEMERFFMTIPEAAQLVMQAGAIGENGNVYLLDMGEPVKIVDLARDLILLSGFEPEVDVPIVVTGIRPGEKLFEELLTHEEGTISSQHEKIFVARKNGLPDDVLGVYMNELFEAASEREPDRIRTALQQIVPEFGEAEESAVH